MMPMLTRRATLAGAITLPVAAREAGASLPAPTGRVLLEVGGHLQVTNAPGEARLDRAMLDAMPQAGFETTTPWTEKRTRFDGIPGAALVAALGARGREVVAVALNDYRVTIPMADFAPGGLLIASRLDGEPIPVRSRGPLWITYPYESRAEFRTELFYSRSIWQLRRLEFRS